MLYEKTTHTFDPICFKDSRVLILGTMPSPKSRENRFYYSHPQNRFWKVLAAIFESEAPKTVEEKRKFILTNRLALWDVIASCDIIGSSDSSIKNVVPNDLSKILSVANIKQIFVNGKTAEKYYNKYIAKQIEQEAICLPSTSPANAAWSFEMLVNAWKIIKL